MSDATEGTATPVMYMTSWCPYCRILIRDLDALGIDYDKVDVDLDSESADFVKSVNNGNRVVPTIKFADGSTLTNPPASVVAARVAQG